MTTQVLGASRAGLGSVVATDPEGVISNVGVAVGAASSAIEVSMPFFDDGDTFYPPTFSTGGLITPDFLASESTIFPPTVGIHGVIYPNPIPRNNVFFPFTISTDVALPEPETPGPPRTILNTNWLNSLVLNILNTRARNDIACPTPAAVYGHWSESYRDDGIYIGSRFWNAAEKSYARVNDAARAIEVMIEADMHKLIQMKLASNVKVDARYIGSGQVGVEITITSAAGVDTTIKLTGALVVGGWEWQ